MKATYKDIALIALLIIAGIVSAKTVTTIILKIGNIMVTDDYRVAVLMSVILGLLLGLSVGIILDIKSRKAGLFAIGFLLMFISDYGRVFPLFVGEFGLSVICGAVISVVSTFKLITVNLSRIFRYLLFVLFVSFTYSLLAPIKNISSISAQNNLIALAIFTIAIIVLGKVVK